MEHRNQVLHKLRNNELVSCVDFLTAFPTPKDMMLIQKLFPDSQIQVPTNSLSEEFRLMNGLLQVPKCRNDEYKRVPVLYQTEEDGSITTFLPAGTPPDTAGFNLNRAAQRERKTKMIHRLQQKRARKEE
jgi:hypothetical protein